MSTRLVPEHFNPRGLPKRAFATYEDAVAFKVAIHQADRLHSYRCPFCGCWHLATNRKAPRRSL
jgi:hypothetical protein